MSNNGKSLSGVLVEHEADLLADWLTEQANGLQRRAGGVKDAELREQSKEFLSLLGSAVKDGGIGDMQGPRWGGVREMLSSLSRSRGMQGYSPSETASFVFSLKKPLFARLRREFSQDGEALAETTWAATELLDKLGLYTTEVHQKSREEVIVRQQQEMLELSTPVVKLWDGILALPMIGTLDSARTQVVMESLLQRIVETGSSIAIIDITGVPTVDTLTAQHLIKTVTAARLMGAECIISGVRPQIAQTIVHLGVDLGDLTTKATLADAFAIALERTGRAVRRVRGRVLGSTSVERIPILRMGEFLLVTIQVDMHDRLVTTLQDDLTTMIATSGARGVLIDISSLDMVDSFIGRMIGNIAGMSRVLDAETVVVGMRPAVAITLVELGLSLTGVRTALNVEKGMALLRAAVRRRPGEARDGRVEG